MPGSSVIFWSHQIKPRNPMITHKFGRLRIAGIFVLLLLVFLTKTHAQINLSTHFPKVTGQESGDYLGTVTTDQGAGSGITWWPGPNTYLLLDNNGSRILEVERTLPPVTALTLRRTIDLDGFGDAEEIHWIEGDTFVIS